MIRRVSLEQDLAALKTLVREHEVGKIVVGLLEGLMEVMGRKRRKCISSGKN